MKSKPRRSARAMRKLTVTEKEARGTRQRAYDPKPRSVADIQADAAWALETLASLRETARQAAASLKELGPVIPSGRGAQSTHKPNPALRIQGWALGAIRQIQRELEFLNEELTLAQAADTSELGDEFAGFD
jgi:hypothetical protein